jgi:hypothetical protein
MPFVVGSLIISAGPFSCWGAARIWDGVTSIHLHLSQRSDSDTACMSDRISFIPRLGFPFGGGARIVRLG